MPTSCPWSLVKHTLPVRSQSSCCAEPLLLIFGRPKCSLYEAHDKASAHDSTTMSNRGRSSSRKSARTRQGPAANALNTEQTNYRSMATEALRLLLAQHNLTGTRQQLISRLETHLNSSPSGGVTVTGTPPSASTLPQEKLAQIISSLIDEKLAARQDSGHQHNQLVLTPHTGSLAIVPSPPTQSSTQDGGHRQQQKNNASSPQAFPPFNPSDSSQQHQLNVATLPQAFLLSKPSSGGQQHHQSVATPPQAFPALNPSRDGQQQQQTSPHCLQPIGSSHRRCSPPGFLAALTGKPLIQDYDDCHHEQ